MEKQEIQDPKREYITLVEKIVQAQRVKYPENTTIPQRILIKMGVEEYKNMQKNDWTLKIEEYAKAYANFYVR
ncbi:hypothetical protein K9L97_01410 [Candidatus Woesearchaeota archaeon]|nr:hypothetical protein [Candidatus Woesearchaeota archaeon]